MKKKQPPTEILKPKTGDRSQDTSPGQRRWFKREWGKIATGLWMVGASIVTGLNLGAVQLLERQMQTVFFEARGKVEPPKEVVILAIDESSLSQGEFFRADPQRYGYLAPIESFPWQRSAYATAIDKLMAAGARAVAIDLIFSTPSSYGEADDRRFAQSLQQHAGRIVLAADYAETETPQGLTLQVKTPLPEFCATSACTGFINFLIEPDGRIHRLGDRFLTQLLQNSPPEQAQVLEQLPSFATSTLEAAQIQPSSHQGDSIFFYGPAHTFEQIPFWYVLDPTTWQTTLQSGAYFKDKIVLIGSTAAVHQDFHAAPFSKSILYPEPMAGVEIHANAIATLLQGRTITEAISDASLRGIVLLISLIGMGFLLTYPKSPLRRLIAAIGLATAWMIISFGLFVFGRLIVPTAIPIGAIVMSGFSQLVIGSVKEQLKKKQLRDTLKQYVTSPIVQEIISQHDDLQDLLRDRELMLCGKVLGSRYRIVRVLGSGGFSETYVAQDLQRPGTPLCVVKQLRVVSDNPNTLKLARRLFATEAETLERLGQHDRIPQLLASFEENHEFYLVQEFIQGLPLSRELLPGRSLSEAKVVQILNDLLDILDFVHNQSVIHRDLKPSNIIRRHSDNRLVLIDFGIAKKITTQLASTSEEYSKFTIAVGTPGYMPSEQSAGYPQFNSDIYALGMIGIAALTGKTPHTLNLDPTTGSVLWMEDASGVSSDLAAILNRMVHHDFLQRYRSAQEVKMALTPFLSLMAVPETVPGFEGEPSDVESDLETLEKTSSLFVDTTVALPEDWMNNPPI